MLICILTKNVITSCSVTMMLFLHLEVKPLMTLTTVLYLSCALISGHLAMMLMELTKRQIGRAVQQECRDRKSGSAGMPRPSSYAVFCLKKKSDDSHRIRSRTFAPLWSRIKRDGPGHRNHARDCRDRFISLQNFVFALGTLSPPALGNRPSVAVRCRPASLSYGATGKVTEKVAPLPEPSLCARMMPPCISTIALLMARPRPRPSRRISSCSNASKIFSRNTGSIPMPVSVISTVIEFGELL